jgi:hypothetical protein
MTKIKAHYPNIGGNPANFSQIYWLSGVKQAFPALQKAIASPPNRNHGTTPLIPNSEG